MLYSRRLENFSLRKGLFGRWQNGILEDTKKVNDKKTEARDLREILKIFLEGNTIGY